MADFFATSGADNFAGTAGADSFVVNHAVDIQPGDTFTGGTGTDTLWVTMDMTDPGGNDVDMPGNLDFSSMVFSSIEILSFNYMKMLMPGQAIFSSAQFGAGLSDTLEVRGAWGDQDITVNLVTGDSSFDASGWTFPTLGGSTTGETNGMPSGTATSVWGAYWNLSTTGMNQNQSVGGTDTIHINGSAGNNTITGSIKDDIINAGDGSDTVVFAGNWADYTITLDAGVFTLTSAATGSDDVSNAELFQFADGTFTASNLLSGNLDVTPPDAPTIEAWTDTTDPILMNGANPLWRISGQAEPGATVKLYSVTLAADGTVTARTQISTYSQGAPNPTTGAPTVVAGPAFVVADSNGNWEFQTNLNEHGDRRVQASATDDSGNVSDYSLIAIQGSHHNTTMSFTDPTALAGISKIDGYHQDNGPDILKFTTATTVTDADFAKVHDIESVQLTGASTITLGANALAAGIGGEITPALGNGGVITGDSDTSITDSNVRVLNVDASAMLAGTTLTLDGAASFNVKGGADGTSVAGGAGNDTVSGNGGADSIDGGDGTDTAVFSGNWADYTISKTGNTFTIAGGTDGGDEVTNVENFQFADGTYTAAQLISGDRTAPDAPTIEAWTDTTDPILMNGANPLWRISGHAEPGAIVKLFTVTLAPDGSVTARTQIATYTQGAPNPATGAPTIVAGPNFVIADSNGNWEFQSNLTEHGDRRVQATATDASENTSSYSQIAIQGGHHNTTLSFADPSAFANISKIDGYHQDNGPDILKFTTATTIVDADFAKIHDIETVELTGASTITLGATALAAGVGNEIAPALGNGGIVTGDGNTTITDTNVRALNVNASAMLAGTTLTLSGTASFKVTGSNAGTTIVAAGGDDTIAGGAGADILKGGAGANALSGGGGDDQLFANSGVETLEGGADNDQIIVNRQAHINAGDIFDGGTGTDVLWLTKGMMDIDMPGDLDFTGTTISSIEVLSFNYMKMLMPGSATFTSDQFGAGLSNTLEVRGAWGDQDITVNLVSGNSSFDASGWTFATLGGTTTGETNGLPSGTATSVWGAYWNLNTTGMNQNQSVGGTDSIHLVGSAGDNTITGSSQNDIIDGGDGTDTAVFSGNWADYSIVETGGTYTITDKRTSGGTGQDAVSNVENFQFANGLVAVADVLNVAPSSISLDGSSVDDTAPPATAVGTLTVTDANAGLGDTATYSLTDDAGGRFAISGNNIVVAAGAALAYGSYDVTVLATDAGGLTASQTFSITIDDATAPTITIASGPAHGINTNVTDATFTWSASDGNGSGVDHYEYSTDGGSTWTATAATSVTLSSLVDGANSFRVRAVDASNNTGLAASRDWTVTTDVPYKGTSAIDIFEGTVADEDFIFNKQAFVNAGDLVDGGDGVDTVWAAEGMRDYEENFNFSAIVFRNMEALAFNYMPMPMPGQVIFSSAQFGSGLLSEDLMIYGAWDDQKITVNLAAGNSSFDASGWQFANAGSTSGTQSAVWGKYTFTGSGMFSGQEVGGNDTIYLTGSSGNNRITGTSVDDILNGGAGADTLMGGGGNDRYFADAADFVIEAGSGGTDTVYAAVAHTLRSNVENLMLTGTANVAGTGNGGANTLTGNAGANTLSGAGGNDALKGGAGHDVLLGGSGNDLLTGGLGIDKLTGGSGLDRFVYTATADSSGSAIDRIYDLRTGDRIDVRLIDANTGISGDQGFVLDALGNRSFAAGHIRQMVSGSNLILDFNTDTDAAAEMRIILMDHGAVKASDFIL